MNMTNNEKRVHQRIVSFNLSYICIDKDGTPILESMGRTLNVSSSGICLETHFPIEHGMLLLLTIALENELVNVRSTVIYCNENKDFFETGIKFLDMDDKARNVVNEFVNFFLENQTTSPPSID